MVVFMLHQCYNYKDVIWTKCATLMSGYSPHCTGYMVLIHKREHVLTFEHNCPFRISNHALVAQSHYNIYAFFPMHFFLLFNRIQTHKIA